MSRPRRSAVLVLLVATTLLASRSSPASGALTPEKVERAVRWGVRFLKQEQRANGSWPDRVSNQTGGTTALAVLALLTAGEHAASPSVQRGMAYLEKLDTGDSKTTYTVALQTMVYAMADPVRYAPRLRENVRWLEEAQISPRDRARGPGSWTYDLRKAGRGDPSNTHYALLGLDAAAEAGVPVRPQVWTLARRYWENTQYRQRRDRGAWAYAASDPTPPGSGSMTCAGVSSLLMCDIRLGRGRELLKGTLLSGCGATPDLPLRAGLAWLSTHAEVGQNPRHGHAWKHYYLHDLGNAGRLSGLQYFGDHDWYREGAEELVRTQDQLVGSWKGSRVEDDPVLATSFALLFLIEGRSPVLIGKVRHGPADDWNQDADDVRNLVGSIGHDWKHRLTWQYVDPERGESADLKRAPILFLNGHKEPTFSPAARQRLREYGEEGGTILAEACCSTPDFDRGFRALIREVFPEPGFELHPLPPDHALWTRHHQLDPKDHPLWGIERGGRTLVIYSPEDLSCSWNQMRRQPENAEVVKAVRLGQNIVDYVTKRTLPPDKLSARNPPVK